MLLKNNYYEELKFDSVVVILIWSCISFSRSPRFKSCSNPLKEINKWKGMYSLLLI